MTTLRLFAALSLLALPLAAQQDPNGALGFQPGKSFQMGDYDTVNLFNGNLTVNLPLGPTFTPGGNLSYSFHLVYNGNAWAMQGENPPEAIPNRFSNAGLGWKMTLGELVAPRDPAARDISTGGNWVYIAADGSEHTFYNVLHAEENNTSFAASNSDAVNTVVGYTHDGSYLRLIRGTRVSASNTHPCGNNIFGFCFDWTITYSIEAPDGNVHTFAAQLEKQVTKGSPTVEEDGKLSYRLVSIVDRFGNYLHVTYPDPLTWVIKDGTTADGDTRTHTVHFINQTFYEYSGQSTAHPFVDSLDLAAFNGQTATYRFAYSDYDTISKNCDDQFGGPTTKTRFLNSLTQPDNSVFSMDYNRIEFNSSNLPQCSLTAGHLLKLTLPTGGKIQYTVGLRSFPGNPEIGGHPAQNAQSHSMGVATRTLVDSANTSAGTWTYKGVLTNPIDITSANGGTTREFKGLAVSVRDPLDQTTISYFTVDHFGDDPSCYPGSPGESEYGMAFTRAPGTALPGGLLLSSQVYDNPCTIPVAPGCNVSCVDAGNQPLQPVRSTYVQYEQDGTSDLHDEERRVTKRRTVFNSDTGCNGSPCYIETDFGTFDGLGHYRTVTQTSNFPGTSDRITTTHYNARGGTYVAGGAGNNPDAYMIAPGSPWLPGVYDFQTTTENNQIATTEFCFNSTTAFLERRRTVRNGDRTKDLLAAYTGSGGNVTGEAYFGGDTHPLAGGFATCTSTLPAAPDYGITHHYTFGSLDSSQYAGVTFKSTNRTIDKNTGLASDSKDVSGLLTTHYIYDKMQRLTEVRPPGEAWTKYTYTFGNPTSLSILRRPFGSDTAASPETSSYLYFDSFGRLVLTKEQFPEGWSTTKTAYDLLGRVVSTSMPEFRSDSSWENFTPAHATATAYDRFDRPRIITLPDLQSTTISYSGNRETRRTVCVSSTLQTQAPCLAGEFPFTTAETVDGHGRLSTVTEPIGNGVTTTYGYDVGNRLTSVSTDAPEGLQHRTFTYDLAGLLISEQHPEKGINGYGTVTYPEYDSRGHLRHRIDGTAGGAFDTTFDYDSAEHLTHVRDLDPTTHNPRDLKVFTFGIDNDVRLGKLQTATRHNYQPSLGGDITVAETYTYGGPNGRISARTTSVNGAFSSNTFSLGQTWDDLGNIHAISYPSNAALTSTPAREVAFSYGNALLTGVTGYTTAITHLASGMISHIGHANGENEEWAADPNGMSRPASINITGSGINQTFGPYAYDGAGNIKRIGDTANTYTNYRYDGAGRLVNSETITPTSPTMNKTWSYDSFGNRLAVDSAQPHQFDPNNDGTIDPADIFFLINYLFMGGRAPFGPGGLLSGDANDDGVVDPADIFFTINFLFLGGPLPSIPSTAFPSGEESGGQPADSITVGTVAATGTTVDVPVYIRDISGTALGMDQAAGAKIQAFSVKVGWSPASAVSSVSFTRTGITSALAPTVESRPSTSLSRSLLDTFQESANPIPFTSNAAEPGDVVAHLVVTLNGSVAPGSSVSLAIDPSVTLLSNDEGTIKETTARGNLVLVNGAINIPAQGLAIPPAVSAFAEGTTPKHALKAKASAANDPDTQPHPRPPIYLSDTALSPSSLRHLRTAQSYVTTTNHNDAATYDEAGDVTVDDQGRLLTYDALNMTTGISLPPANGTTRNFLDIYTADDERIALVEKLSTGETKTRWTLRGLDNRALRTWTDNTFNGTHTWAWSEDEIFAGATLLAYVSPVGTRHYGVDHLGSTVVLTDDNAHLIGNLNYDAFGAGGATGAGMLQYTGHERDSVTVGAQTGTVRLPDYLHARNYDPLRGRFLSVDPEISVKATMHRPQKWNRYAYVVNNPICYLDPTGKQEAAGFAMDRDVQDLMAHRITEKEYWDRLNARGIGAAVGAGAVVTAVYAPAALSAINTFALEHFAVLRFIMAIGGAATGAPTVQSLQRAAQGGGPTVQLVTNLTQAPQAGRSLSAASGESAEALAAAARSGDGVKTFVANIPQALLNGLEQAGMLRVSTTEMNGVQATEYRFSASAMEFVLRFFTERPPTQ